MKNEVSARAALKAACLEVLDQHGIEHPAGHQSKLAARYVLISQSGERIPLMFEKAPNLAAQLWLRKERAARASDYDLEARDYPAAALFVEDSGADRTLYGRHSALKAMRDMANIDLVRLTIDRVGQLRQLIEAMRS